jgi:hypothetical protein
MRIVVVIALFVACAVNVASQQVSSQSRAQALAAAFNKQKHGVKEKYGVRTEKFKDVRSELVVKQNAGEYAGTYEMAEFGLVINLQVGTDGRVQADWYKHGQRSRTIKRQNAKIEGALLTAFKVYEDGTSETFEGVFLNRTVRDSPNAPGVTTFGVGVVLNTPFEANGLTYDKLFFELKQ